MYEATATESTRQAIATAHAERAAAFAAIVRWLSLPFHALPARYWPQVGARRWHASPQGCPAGQ